MPEFIHGVATFGKRTKAYCAWTAMRGRCNTPTNQDFHYYGGRGIKVCPRWDSFLRFVADMGEPKSGETLDRVDNNKGYTPRNCRWATRKTQGRNRNYCRLSVALANQIRNLYVRGKIKQIELAKQFGVSQVTISLVIRRLIWV